MIETLSMMGQGFQVSAMRLKKDFTVDPAMEREKMST